MNIVLYDDDTAFLSQCSEGIQSLKNRLAFSFSITSFSEPEEFCMYVKDQNQPSLYFIDIVSEQTTRGFELAEYIIQHRQQHVIIFMTAYPDNIMFNTKYKYLARNIIIKNKNHFFTELTETILLAYQELCQNSVFVCGNRETGTQVIQLDKILYFESVKGRKKVILAYENGSLTFYSTLKETMDKLDSRFFQCHKSFIVNLMKIEQITSKELILTNKGRCPYSCKEKQITDHIERLHPTPMALTTRDTAAILWGHP